jgi:hypothetical protein
MVCPSSRHCAQRPVLKYHILLDVDIGLLGGKAVWTCRCSKTSLIWTPLNRTSLNPDKGNLYFCYSLTFSEEIATYFDHLRHLRELIIKEISSKSGQMKTVSSNPALRQVLLLQRIQDHQFTASLP